MSKLLSDDEIREAIREVLSEEEYLKAARSAVWQAAREERELLTADLTARIGSLWNERRKLDIKRKELEIERSKLLDKLGRKHLRRLDERRRANYKRRRYLERICPHNGRQSQLVRGFIFGTSSCCSPGIPFTPYHTYDPCPVCGKDY